MNRILIAYATKYGCTEKCAGMLADKLNQMGQQADLCNLKSGASINLQNYDKILIGGSIYAGRIQKEVSVFCSGNRNALVMKKLGFFICGLSEGETAEKQLETCFPQELLSRASARENFGSQLIFEKMNFMERMIIKKITKKDSDYSNILEANIDRFAQVMSEA